MADQVPDPGAMADQAPDPAALGQWIFQEMQVLCWKTKVIFNAKFLFCFLKKV
jgi:hypothetical protein